VPREGGGSGREQLEAIVAGCKGDDAVYQVACSPDGLAPAKPRRKLARRIRQEQLRAKQATTVPDARCLQIARKSHLCVHEQAPRLGWGEWFGSLFFEAPEREPAAGASCEGPIDTRSPLSAF
jgi:hypothetical protein